MIVLYFTATGNNLYLAKNIGGEIYSIPQVIKENKVSFHSEKIGLVFPVYGLAVPKYIQDFLSTVELKSDYIFAVMSYGAYSGAVSTHLQKLAHERGFEFSYINTIKMVDNYLPAYDMEKQIETESKKNIEKHLEIIKNDIHENAHKVVNDSFIDKIITKQYRKKENFDIGVGITKNYQVEDTCTKCGICEKVCPMDNIQVNNQKPIFNNYCTSCLACTQNCPQNSIRLSSEKSRMRFRNQHITLKEIINANHNM